MGYREEVVIAHIVAAWLSCVAFEVFLLVTPNLLSGHHKHHHPEEEDNGEPHTAKRCGVLVNPTQEALEECPVHGEVVCPPFWWKMEEALNS